MDDGHEGVDDDPHDVVMSMASNSPLQEGKGRKKTTPRSREGLRLSSALHMAEEKSCKIRNEVSRSHKVIGQ